MQLWIPPRAEGPAIVEGAFVQTIYGDGGSFGGSRPASLPSDLEQQLTDHCWLLADVFQRLGYVGRCSFDLILVGTDLDDCHPEFIECNARWGGTSLPMTLLHRIFGDWTVRRPFSIEVFRDVPGLEHATFEEVQEEFSNELFDVRSGQGMTILFNPGQLRGPVGHFADSVARAASGCVGPVRFARFGSRARSPPRARAQGANAFCAKRVGGVMRPAWRVEERRRTRHAATPADVSRRASSCVASYCTRVSRSRSTC